MSAKDSAHVRVEDGEIIDFGVIGQISQSPEVFLDVAYSCVVKYAELHDITPWEAIGKAFDRNKGEL